MDADELRGVLARADCLADEARVESAIDAVATEVTRDLAHRQPLFLCVMRGGLVFGGKLLTRLHFPLEVDYLHATRYGDTTKGGILDWRATPTLPLEGRHLLIVDDILDEGATLAAILEAVRGQQPASVRTAVLVDKRHDRKAVPGMRADYTGLEMPDRYLFGYGMDYRGWWRNAPGIYAVHGL